MYFFQFLHGIPLLLILNICEIVKPLEVEDPFALFVLWFLRTVVNNIETKPTLGSNIPDSRFIFIQISYSSVGATSLL